VLDAAKCNDDRDLLSAALVTALQLLLPDVESRQAQLEKNAPMSLRPVHNYRGFLADADCASADQGLRFQEELNRGLRSCCGRGDAKAKMWKTAEA
jgi:hypothetical protein